VYQRALDPHNPRSLAGRSRLQRWARLNKRFPDLATMTVLDLGGWPAAWDLAPVRPKHVTCVNTVDYRQEARTDISVVVADALELPDEVTNAQFDLVYSNSLIEHIGGKGQRQRFAAAVCSTGTHYWVQAPYRYFPIEPHWVFPFFQFLPLAAKATVSRHWDAGGYTSKGCPETSVELALEVELPTITDFRYLFSGSEIIVERFAGVPKSIIATA
jgi:hypothetical protein